MSKSQSEKVSTDTAVTAVLRDEFESSQFATILRSLEGHDVNCVLQDARALAEELLELLADLAHVNRLNEEQILTATRLEAALLCSNATLAQLELSLEQCLQTGELPTGPQRIVMCADETQACRDMQKRVTQTRLHLQRSIEALGRRLVAIPGYDGGYVTYTTLESTVFLVSRPTVSTRIDIPAFRYVHGPKVALQPPKTVAPANAASPASNWWRALSRQSRSEREN